MHNGDVSGGNISPETMAPAPIRMLVVAGDIGYRERAYGVLGELGDVAFALTLPTDPDDVTWLVRKARPNVVVLDATGCEAAVTGVIAALAARAPAVGVVVVCEHLTDAARDLRALPKWGWRRELRAGVERASFEGNPLGACRKPLRGPRHDLRSAAGAATAGR